jgi:hypothetical protein
MARCVSRDVLLRYLSHLERTGVTTVYWNNIPLTIGEARKRLAEIARAYLHRGMVYVP